jgi:hypothetical protein
MGNVGGNAAGGHSELKITGADRPDMADQLPLIIQFQHKLRCRTTALYWTLVARTSRRTKPREGT